MPEPLEEIDLSGKTDYVSISISISSDWMQPESMTQKIGLQPTSTRLRGTPIRNGMLRRPEFDLHEWYLRREFRLPNGDLIREEAERFISDFLDELLNSAKAIYDLSREHSVMIHLVYNMGYIPCIGLTGENVRIIAALGAAIDYDIMVDAMPRSKKT
jgi:Domain of unknown function (DUF4279)